MTNYKSRIIARQEPVMKQRCRNTRSLRKTNQKITVIEMKGICREKNTKFSHSNEKL